jgi:hypothetical protein
MFTTTQLVLKAQTGEQLKMPQGVTSAKLRAEEQKRDTHRLPDLGDTDLQKTFDDFLRYRPGLREITINSSIHANFQIDREDVSSAQAVLYPQYDGSFILKGGKPELTNSNTVASADGAILLALKGDEQITLQPGQSFRISGVYLMTIPQGPSYLQLDISAKLSEWLSSLVREFRAHPQVTEGDYLQCSLGHAHAQRFGKITQADVQLSGCPPALMEQQLFAAVSTAGAFQVLSDTGLDRPNWVRWPNDGTGARHWEKLTSGTWHHCPPHTELSLGGCYYFTVPDFAGC